MAATWIVVAENSRARIFAMDNKKAPLQELADLVHPEGRSHGRELSSDRPGRTFDSKGRGRHAKEANVNVKQQEAINFAKKIAEYVESARTHRDFDKLILIAAPEFLGMLRKNLSAASKQLITKEVNKNIVQKDSASIRKHLMD